MKLITLALCLIFANNSFCQTDTTRYVTQETPRYFSQQTVNQWSVLIINHKMIVDTVPVHVFCQADKGDTQPYSYFGDMHMGFAVTWHHQVLYYLTPHKRPIYSVKPNWYFWSIKRTL